MLSKEKIRKHIPTSQNTPRIKSVFQGSHLTQVFVTVKLAQVFAFQLSYTMFSGNRTALFNCAANEAPVNLPGPRRFVIIARQDVDVDVIVADVPKDCVAKISATQTILIKAQHPGKRFVGHSHVSRDFALVMTSEPFIHQNRQRMTKLASAHRNDSSEATNRVLKQLARELLLAQSSDWAFLMRTGTAREYATKRTIDHLTRFNKLHDQFAAGQLDEKFLADCEWRDNLFPNLNWRYYCSGGL